jgi:hypothetical protein
MAAVHMDNGVYAALREHSGVCGGHRVSIAMAKGISTLAKKSETFEAKCVRVEARLCDSLTVRSLLFSDTMRLLLSSLDFLRRLHGVWSTYGHDHCAHTPGEGYKVKPRWSFCAFALSPQHSSVDL